MWPARKNALSKPSEIDWKYGEPMAASPRRNTGVVASAVGSGERCHGRLVTFRAW